MIPLKKLQTSADGDETQLLFRCMDWNAIRQAQLIGEECPAVSVCGCATLLLRLGVRPALRCCRAGWTLCYQSALMCDSLPRARAAPLTICLLIAQASSS